MSSADQDEARRRAKLRELQALVTEGLASGLSSRTKDDIRRLSRETANALRVERSAPSQQLS